MTALAAMPAPLSTTPSAFSAPRTFVMAGGGTGGHVMPALAVARELKSRGHQPVFIGTRAGFEARLVPQSGFPLEWIEIGALQRVGFVRTVRTLVELPFSLLRSYKLLKRHRPAAVFSMGGFVAGPVVLAALVQRIPVVVMEPNAIPGLTNRRIGHFVKRALLSFPEAASYFPKERVEITGLPVRPEFFDIPDKPPDGSIAILVTGGSRGARTLNRAAEESWSLFRRAGMPVRLLHQTGAQAYDEIARAFSSSGLAGEVVPFIDDMPAAFAQADLVVCRSGAGAVAEVAAAGKPSILVPFPFAADDHQFHNASAMSRIGAARLVPDREMNGRRLFDEISRLFSDRAELRRMSALARGFAHPDAARRAADLLEKFGRASA